MDKLQRTKHCDWDVPASLSLPEPPSILGKQALVLGCYEMVRKGRQQYKLEIVAFLQLLV